MAEATRKHIINNKPEPEAEAASGKNGKFEHSETKEWKAKAREIGEQWMNEQRQQGNDPSVIMIAQYVEGEFSRLGITGKQGRLLYFETIKKGSTK